MTPAYARELRAALKAAYPGASAVQVSPDPGGGATIVIEEVAVCGNSEPECWTLRLRVGEGNSPILNVLLAGRT